MAKLKDIIYVVTLIVGMVVSYFTGQIKTNAVIENLHLIVKDNERAIAVSKVEITTLKEHIKEININQKKQNEQNTKLFELVYRYVIID